MFGIKMFYYTGKHNHDEKSHKVETRIQKPSTKWVTNPYSSYSMVRRFGVKKIMMAILAEK